MTTRYAIVKGARDKWEVAAYLPDNYEVIYWNIDGVVIAGTDVAGWTLDKYVIPRLGSGNMGCYELAKVPF